MKKIIIIIFLCTVIIASANNKLIDRSPVYPSVWHKPDTVLMYPALKDTMSSPDAYTMMMVYRSTQPDTVLYGHG